MNQLDNICYRKPTLMNLERRKKFYLNFIKRTEQRAVGLDKRAARVAVRYKDELHTSWDLIRNITIRIVIR
jgi:hypothetical protein